MFIIIQDNNVIHKINLIDEYKYKGIHLYKKNTSFYIELTNGYYFEDNTKTKQLNIQKYVVYNNLNLYEIYIYVYEGDNGINEYKLYNNEDFIIADNNKASILCNDLYLKGSYLSIQNGIISTNFNILVNGNRYTQDKLSYGSKIEYLGIRIYYYKDFLYINSFNIKINIKQYNLISTVTKYIDEKLADNYYIPEDIYELKIPEIVEYNPIKMIDNVELIKSLLPNIVMSISMSFMAILNYRNTIIQNPDTSIVSYIVMPISMAITSILMPVIFAIVADYKNKQQISKTKQEYLDYLSQYKEDLLVEINKHISSLNTRYFDLFNSKKMMFYANPSSSEYLKLSVGKTKLSKQIDMKYYGDKQIDDSLKLIKQTLENIEDYPLYIDIKKNHKITIVSKKIDKKYYFYSVLLELAYKHHYDDIHIAVYAKGLSVFDSFYNLPHLFINDKRLTLVNDEQLQLLEQTKIDKPVILLMYEKSNVHFVNTHIYQIYFSVSINDILKDSNSIVEYINNEGYLYAENKIRFKRINEMINFSNYFAYIGKLRNISLSNKTYTFLDTFDTNISEYYKKQDHNLCANFAFNNNELISLDLHESKHGPHGLIGGSTGSGKSELIVSLLLSLCVKYSPEYLNIVLIDYKGGGIKESLSYNGTVVPHIIASISNLENNSLQRLIIALNNECKNRQQSFKRLSQICNTSIMNIDDYLDNNRCEYGIGNISHLLIVVDEFAELKKENPEQIKELISISRIGRSLGIHLILATQKPSGVIDDEIWSNSRFKIALKVFDEKDSLDIIKSKDAAYLNNPGSFYMRVDSSLIKGQAIYTKSDINGNDPIKVSILNNQLEVNKTYKKQTNKSLSTASYYCMRINEASKEYRHNTLEFLPPEPKDRHSLTSSKCFVMGEIDDYLNNAKGLLTYGFTQSLLIYSTRKNEINAILNTLNENRIRNIVIGNNTYKGLYTSDSILNDNSEDILYLFNHLLNNKNNKMCLVIEDVYTLLSYEESYLDILCKLVKRSENIKLSLVFISTSSQISFKLINAFKNRVLINIAEQADLMSFYGMRSKYTGNSYFYNAEPISFVPIKIEKLVESNSVVEKLIRHIPEIINGDIKDNKYLIGYDIHSKLAVYATKNVEILSLDNDLLSIYSDTYDSLNTNIYDYKYISNSNEILWLGSGIFNQRLFITGLKDDLDDSTGIYIKNNKKQIVRSINNVSKVNEI